MHHYAECIQNFGTTNNYNTEMFECFHIDYAKEGWRATNLRDELLQMIQWLSRQEKVAIFETYLKDYHSTEVEREQEEQDPESPSQPLSSIISKHRCPFLHHLRVYLNRLLPRGEAISCIQLPHARLLFHQLDVWHTFKFSLDTLGNDVDGQEEIDSVRAKPGKGRAGDVGDGRFDVVVVAQSDKAENILAYPGYHHNMYSVTKAIGQNNNIVPGDIVSLSTIHQSCHLISHLDPNISWPSSWNFLLNNWSSKFAYQTLW
ncbi:hypothetical protein EV702DRAFT_1179144 [Suillus placidus]|uniref:Uncharacterized protein n=1 Tax=Suillus placidus TaxID=48579 RepID=A0A9P7D481_9AGAM|nr:hypothetical protein EV702DRAFT_1179144 [Suillus placidus]